LTFKKQQTAFSSELSKQQAILYRALPLISPDPPLNEARALRFYLIATMRHPSPKPPLPLPLPLPPPPYSKEDNKTKIMANDAPAESAPASSTAGPPGPGQPTCYVRSLRLTFYLKIFI